MLWRESALRMIVVRFAGGLGNQLFQVAFAHHLAQVTGRKAVVDRSWFRSTNRDQPRPLELEAGVCGLRFVTLPDVAFGRAQRFVAPFRVTELHSTDDVVAKIRRSTMLVIGYFQSAELVLAHRDRMARIIEAHVPAPPESFDPFVAVHVRLGDYLSNPAARRVHAVTDPMWSIEEGHRLARASGCGIVRVFTDDVVSLRQLVRGSDDTVVDDSVSSWDALSRMSRCEALVMSNSTLSWWAGFAARHVHGRDIPVLCPTPWFASTSAFDDRIPLPGWTKVQRRLLGGD